MITEFTTAKKESSPLKFKALYAQLDDKQLSYYNLLSIIAQPANVSISKHTNS
jgi:hypothetical protein